MTNPNDLVFSDKQGEYLKPLIDNNRHKSLQPDLEYKSGLTKREWYAGLIMQGIIASGNLSANNSIDDITSDCLKYTDALIAKLQEGRSHESGGGGVTR